MIDGQPQQLDTRLFMQLQVFTGCEDSAPLIQAIEERRLECTLYQDVNDPQGIGLLTMHEDPTFFVTSQRDLLSTNPFRSLQHKPHMTMLGRTYASGHEQDLEDWLLRKPRRTVFHPKWPWAIWYPLRRSGAFAQLSPEERCTVLLEHAAIGRSYGAADLAHDVRLACHGLDQNDNEFVIGLIGEQLHPLSHIVQTMRSTRQTSQYIQQMGPFFVGHTLWCPSV